MHTTNTLTLSSYSCVWVIYLFCLCVMPVRLAALVLEGSSLFSFVAMKAILPVSILLYTARQWPLLPENDSHLSPAILVCSHCIPCALAIRQLHQ